MPDAGLVVKSRRWRHRVKGGVGPQVTRLDDLIVKRDIYHRLVPR
jgi:hypothetical protein